MTLGDEIYSEIEKNKYLIKIYSEIMKNYGELIFYQNINNIQYDINHICRFIDLLSKSTSKEKNYFHKNIAQEMIILLEILKPESLEIKHLFGSVLSNLNNYVGLNTKQYGYKSCNFYEEVYFNYMKDILKVPTENNKYFLESQKEVFEKFGTDYFSYSGPTSMGKSFIMRSFIKNRILKDFKENYVILVPTKALINEVKGKVIQDLNINLEKKSFKVITTANSKENNQVNYIYVLTPERFLYLLIKNPNLSINYLFVDEAHKISSDDARSAFYYKVIDMVSQKNINIFFSSPNIPNPEIYLKILKRNVENKSKNYMYTPVNQFKFFIDIENNKKYIYSTLENKLLELSIKETQNEHKNLPDILLKIGNKKQNIVYCSSKAKAVEHAVEYINSIQLPSKIDGEILELIKEIQRSIHEECNLIEMLRKEVAFHVAYLPIAIKEEIENLYRKGKIKTIFCTSTLIEGVNLPAENLYIISPKQGNKNMNIVDFKNLMGRTGRVEYNLYGNVFIIKLDNSIKEKQIEELLTKQIEPQKLSIEKNITKKTKQEILDSFLEGDSEIKIEKNLTEENYIFIRKIANILLRDILGKNESYIKKQFSDILSKEKEERIRVLFSNEDIDDDINLSVDQIKNLRKSIKEEDYPEEISYNEILNFLNKLSEIYKWEVYEKSTLGRSKNILKYYSLLLNKWMNGSGTKQMIKNMIDYKLKNRLPLYLNQKYIGEFENTKEHKNIVINDILNDIEEVILFKISNYFLRFSLEKKKINKDKLKNDWYEFIEYGTNNKLSILLQEHGFSREAAKFIKEKKDMYVMQNEYGELKLNKNILYCEEKFIKKELNEIKFNFPELFNK